ncbi:MAG: hypothetical protein ACYS74_16795, partial [Planctomycetota bacterium]
MQSMERQVEEYIHGLSDIDLLEYTRMAAHVPEALEFARIELADRHLPGGRIAELDEQLQQRQKAQQEAAEARAAEPLPREYRLGVFLCGLYFGLPLVFFIPAWRRFREQGLDRKYKDMWTYAVTGFCLQPILILLRLPPWSWLAALL